MTTRIAAAVLIAVGMAAIVHGTWIPVKAWVAQQLIEHAWRTPGARPWPWADTEPVARLAFVRQQRSLIVLAGDSGAVLAFGPGLHRASARPAAGGNAVISGHRDTHFAVLREVRVGDPIVVEPGGPGQDAHGVRYGVVATRVVDSRDPTAVAAVLADRDDDRLSLVTCWPFDGVAPGTPWRYVVVAARVEPLAHRGE